MGKSNIRPTNKKGNQKSKRMLMANRKRLLIAFAVIMVMMIILIIRLFYINIKHGSEYSKMVLDQQSYTSTVIPFKRGDITDRNGTVIATSEKVYNVIMDAYVMKNSIVDNEGDCVEPSIRALVNYFDLDEGEIRTQLSNHPDSRYIVLKKQLPYSVIKEYNDFKDSDDPSAKYVKGIWFEEDYVRKYPYNSLACDLIGFTNSGNAGSYGIEEYYNSTLNGTEGRSYVYYDESVESKTIPAVNGYNVVSTIDVNVQNIIEKYIKQYYNEVGAKNIAVLVMDPNSCEVLGMASAPDFNLNNPRDLSGIYSPETLAGLGDEELVNLYYDLWKNFCITELFEPGSTVKTMTVAAALDESVVSTGDTYYCDGGEQFEEHYVKCHKEDGHGYETLAESLMYSCNDALMEIAAKLGYEKFGKYQKDYGFGQYTGIDLPGEASGEGMLYDPAEMKPIDLATNSFGQNYNVTMIQVAAEFCAVINGGDLYKPYVVKEIVSEDGSVAQENNKQLVKTVCSERTSAWMREALRGTVLYGTGTEAAVEGYKIGGKTGTAEKLPRDSGKNLVSFAGFAPYDNPEVFVYVIVDEPNVADQGDSSIPCRISARIMKELLPYLGIYPEVAAE